MAKRIAKKVRRNPDESSRFAGTKMAKQKGKGWEERLRLTGDARFTEVAWSGHDHPSWPLPRK